jgi:RND family efflux transporter MFP subunit
MLQAGAEFTINIPNKNAPNYNANYNAYQLALQTHDKAIADAQANIANNNSSSSVVEAQIAQAKASVESAQARLVNAQIVAPFSGTVTQFDAKIGQFAPPSTPLISIMSDTGYEVDAGVSEIDIGKVSVGDVATMTLDAFPGETFTGTVFYIAPAETNTGGVISYQVKISFSKIDPRLKSGLTANIDIQTKSENNALILPQYAILQNDQGTFVETIVNNKIKQIPVTLGIEDNKGNVEIVSGVTEGEQVLNIGLKS